MYTLSEIEQERRQRLRKGAADSVSTVSSKVSSSSASSLSPAPEELMTRYETWLAQSRSDARKKLAGIQTEIAYEQFRLEEAREESRRHSVNGERRSTPETRRHVLRMEQLKKDLSDLLEKDPDVFYAHVQDQVLQDMQDERMGRLVDVPYLVRARRQIRTSLEAGIPVYLVGHLGSGKTQLAVECAEDYMRDHLLQKKLHESMESFRERNVQASLDSGSVVSSFNTATNKKIPVMQDSTDLRTAGAPDLSGDELSYFRKIYPQIQKEVEEADCHPYFIAGSHNLTTEDMFFEKTLKLTHSADGSSDSEQLNQLINGFASFVKENEGLMKNMNPDQQMELMLAGWKTFSQLYIAENTGYGTTVEKIEKEVLKAVREGRPIVIDEINTIAMANLIGLNDILQHHAGQTAYITGVGSLTIADGFCLIGTGNLSTGTVTYEGTNVLNPAFQSRFTTIVYNYVPQNTEGTLGEQKHPEENELFRLILDHLCAEDGTLTIPEPSKTLRELWQLAQLARISQNIFEGHSSTVNADGDTPVLNEAVLSIRNIIHVLDHWNFGEEEDLSTALWNGFLSSVTNADDRNLFLALAVRFGFFLEQDGWHIESRGRGDAALTFDEIRTAPLSHHVLPLQTLSSEDVGELLYGKGPKRTSIPDSLKNDIMLDAGTEESISEAEKLDENLRHLEHSSLILGQAAENGANGITDTPDNFKEKEAPKKDNPES